MSAQKPDAMTELAHDLRSPLAAIRALAEVMLDDPAMAPAMRADLLARIVDETARLGRLADRLLDGGEVVGSCDLVAVTRSAVRSLHGITAARGITVDLDLPPQALVAGGADRVSQVMANLLSNAARHARSRIMLRIARSGDMVALTVADDGPGFAGEPGHEPGHGLGLPIARRIAQGLGGRITIASTGQGARVTLTLPESGET